MPLNAPCPLILRDPHRFNQIVVAPRDRFQALAQLIDGLVMHAVNVRYAVEDGCYKRVGSETNGMAQRIILLLTAVDVAGGSLGDDVLQQRAPKRHVEHLMAPANAQHGAFFCSHSLQQAQFTLIPFRLARPIRVGLSIGGGIHVRSSRQEEAIQPVDDGVEDVTVCRNRQENRCSARREYGVGHGTFHHEEFLVFVESSVSCGKDITRNTDGRTERHGSIMPS